MSSTNIKNIFNFFCYKTVKSLCVFTGILILAGTILSQNVQYMGGSEDLSLRGNSSINPTTLGMELKIPLQNYAGRGGTSLPVVLFYSSKVWRMDYGGYVVEGPVNLPQDQYSWATANYGDQENRIGWTSSLDFPTVVVTGTPEYYDANGVPCGLDCINNYPFYVRRLRIKMPNGSTHEFRADDKVYATGQQSQSPPIYYSVDGTRMRYVVDGNGQATLYMPDGSRYLMDQGVFIDRNGNKLVRQSNNWIDTLGRSIPVPSLTPPQISSDTTYTLPSLNGTTSTYTFRWRMMSTILSNNQTLKPVGCQNPYNFQTCLGSLFSNTGGNTRVGPMDSSCTGFDTIVLSEIELPNGAKYKFLYNEYGEIAKVIYPTGAYERFRYEQGGGLDPMSEPYDQVNRGVRERWVGIENSSQNEMHWQYLPGSSATHYSVTTTAPDGSKNVRVYKKGRGSNQVYGFDDALAGSLIEEVYYSSTNQIIQRTLNSYSSQGARGIGAQPTATRDGRLDKQIFISFEPGNPNALVLLKKYEYDSNPDLEYYAYLNVKDSKTYGYVATSKTAADDEGFSDLEGLFTSLTPISHTQTIYQYDSNYKSRGILSLPIESRNLNPANPSDILNKSQYIYDEQGQYYSMVDYGSTTSYEVPTGNYAHLRGNATTLKTWVKETTTWLETHTQYDNFGNARKVWDPNGNIAETQYDSLYYYAYPTKFITPAPDPNNLGHGTTEKSEISTTYDFTTGLTVTATNLNDLTTSVDDQTTATEYDVLLRPIRVYPVNFAAPEGRTEYGVPDTNGQYPANQRFVKVKKQIDATNWREAITWFDGLGRPVKTEVTDSQGVVFTETQYDEIGRVKQVTNPYRIGDTKFWSKPRYDEVSRVVESYAPAPEGQIGASLGVTFYSISTEPGFVGTVVTSTDPSLRKSRSITNALGQLLRVDEATTVSGNADTDLGTLSSPNQPTYYQYDERGNLKQINQGGQERNFTYDSFSRIKSATNPESGTINYTYDLIGNLKTKRDARGIKTIYDYDKSNRIIRRCYRIIGTGALGATTCAGAASETVEPNSPDVSYFYDGKGLTTPQSPNFAKGKLTKVSNSASETLYTEFDSLGRILTHQQVTDGQTYQMSYKYNLSGALIEETYPSGKIVRNFFEADGDLARVVKNGKTYASDFSYSSVGAIEKMRLGNGNWESVNYNERFQPIQIGIGNAPNNTTNLWKVNYEYGELQVDGITVDAAKNNGNVAKQIITVQNAGGIQGFEATQTYVYDSLNRLKQAKEKIADQTNWQQTFNYDRYGNRNFIEATTTTLPKGCWLNDLPIICENQRKSLNPTPNQVNNQLKIEDGYEYDANGNLVKDADGRSFTYDALNKQTEVKNSSNQSVGKYFYDGEGKRIKKIGGTDNTLFVYDAFGSLIAEYAIGNPQPNPTPNISYLTTDTLGSPRIITGKNGEVISRRDFMPFGEEIAVNESNRKSALGYNYGSSSRQAFAGYEKDAETELEFAQNRYYFNKHGRFTTPDPLMASGKVADAQSWNRYSYVRNNPLNLTDPLGLIYGEGLDTDGRWVVKWFADEAAMKAANFTALTTFIYALDGGFQVFNPTGGEGAVLVATAAEAVRVFIGFGGTALAAEGFLVAAGIAATEAAAILATVTAGTIIGAPAGDAEAQILQNALGTNSDDPTNPLNVGSRLYWEQMSDWGINPFDYILQNTDATSNSSTSQTPNTTGQSTPTSPNQQDPNEPEIPQKVTETLDKVKQSGGRPPAGYKGGRTFRNDGRDNGEVLPRTDSNGGSITYKEYDVNPYTRGINRGSERLVRGSDGSAYYTSDHYRTFTKIE